MKTYKIFACAIMMAAMALLTVSASASVISSSPISVSVTGGAAGEAPAQAVWDLSIDDQGNFDWTRPGQWGGSNWMMEDIHLQGNVDPVISADFSVHNVSAVTQSYSFTFSLPVSAIPGSTLTGGSVGVTVTDTNGDGATVGVSGAGLLYDAQIDGVSYQTLSVLPLSSGSFLSNTAGATFGSPIPSQAGPSVAGNIGIKFDFTLTPDDRVGITAVFVVVDESNVPEPASLALLASGALALVYRRRAA